MGNTFKLAGIPYEEISGDVSFIAEDGILWMSLDVEFSTENEDLDFEVREGNLRHENGFPTGVSSFEDLVGKKFIWQARNNSDDIEAGFCYVVGLDEITSGEIEVLAVTEDSMDIRWSGTMDILWEAPFDADVPFVAEFTCKLERQPMTHRVYPFYGAESRLDACTSIIPQNPHKLRDAFATVTREHGWADMRTDFEFTVCHNEVEYPAKLDFAGGKKEDMTLHLAEGCPVALRFCSLSRQMDEVSLYFELEGRT